MSQVYVPKEVFVIDNILQDLLKFPVENLLLIGMFRSGIFYHGRTLSPDKQDWFYLNPMATILESYRAVLLENTWPDFQALLWPSATAAGLMLLGLLVIRKLDRDYPRIVRTR